MQHHELVRSRRPSSAEHPACDGADRSGLPEPVSTGTSERDQSDGRLRSVVLGSVLSGVLTVASWRLIFLINIPVGIAAVALAVRAAPSPRRDVPFDRLGFTTAVLAMGALRGLSPFRTGLVFLPMMLIGGALTLFSAAIAERIGVRAVVCTGLVLMAVGLALLAVASATASPPTVAALMLLVGLAGPLIMPPITALLLNSVPDSLAGTASGVFNTSRQLGGALAIAVFGALLDRPEGFLPGVRISLLVAAIVAVGAAATSRLLTAPTAD